jgi:hypothetical protein
VGDHEAAGYLREIGGQIVGDSIGGKFKLRIVREIGKGQHNDRQARWNRNSRLGRGLPLLNRAHETNALADSCADQPLLFAAVADYAASSINPAGKRRLRNDPSAPDRGQEIVLADDPVPVADQKYQKVEHLRLHRRQHSSAPRCRPKTEIILRMQT